MLSWLLVPWLCSVFWSLRVWWRTRLPGDSPCLSRNSGVAIRAWSMPMVSVALQMLRWTCRINLENALFQSAQILLVPKPPWMVKVCIDCDVTSNYRKPSTNLRLPSYMISEIISLESRHNSSILIEDHTPLQRVVRGLISNEQNQNLKLFRWGAIKYNYKYINKYIFTLIWK